MKRRLLTLAGLLVAGATISLAFAIGCAMIAAVDASPTRTFRDLSIPGTTEIAEASTAFGATRFVVRGTKAQSAGTLPASSRLPALLGTKPVAAAYLAEDLRGIPYRCLTWLYDSRSHGDGPQDAFALTPFRPDPAANVWIDPFTVRAIPLTVLPAGLALNTLFWAAVLWIALSARRIVARLRSSLRSRRGLCPRCAHSLSGTPACPECGLGMSDAAG
jgi:hypothetical protein